MKFGRNQIKNEKVRVTTTMDGQAENNRAPPTFDCRGPYDGGVLINLIIEAKT